MIRRNQIQGEYADLKRQMEEFTASVEEGKKNPVSKYDPLIAKQSYFNDTLSKQVWRRNWLYFCAKTDATNSILSDSWVQG